MSPGACGWLGTRVKTPSRRSLHRMRSHRPTRSTSRKTSGLWLLNADRRAGAVTGRFAAVLHRPRTPCLWGIVTVYQIDGRATRLCPHGHLRRRCHRAHMVDRAHYLARTLISRVTALEAAAREDAGTRYALRGRRLELVAKVLAVELGVTEGATIAVIESALPELVDGHRPTDRDVSALAGFLRKHLGRQLAE